MVDWLIQTLRRLGALAPFTQDDVINAEIEDTFREHKKTVRQFQDVTASRHSGNAKLRQAIIEANIRSTPFAEFERSIRREHRSVY